MPGAGAVHHIKLRHRLMSASRQLYPRKQIFACAAISVAMGQEATSKSRTERGSRWLRVPVLPPVQMYLARIEPEKPGYDLRTFECPRCQHVETAVVQFK